MAIGSVSVAVVPDATGFWKKFQEKTRTGADRQGEQLGRPLGDKMGDVAGVEARRRIELALKRLKADANINVDANDKQAKAKLLAIQARIVELGKTAARPNVDVVGAAKAEAQIAALDAQLEQIGRRRETATVGVNTRGAESGLSRVLDGLVALTPAGVPVLGALAGAAGAMGTAFVTAGAGVAAFGGLTAAAIAQASKDAKTLKTANTAAASSSKSLQSAQAAVASAQARVNSTTGSSTTATNSLTRARLSLSQAEKRLNSATTSSSKQSARLAIERAQLGVSQAQQRVTKASASAAQSHSKATGALSAAQTRLADAQKKNTAAQQQLNDATAAYTPAERQLTTSVEKIKNSFHGFVSDEIPAVSGVLAGFFPLMQDGFRTATPIIGGTSRALQGLEKDAHRALNTPFYKEFFGYLGDQAGPTVTTLGHDVGNLATGFAGIGRAFGPLQVQLEGGLERLTRRFSKFGQGATSNASFLDFMTYVEKEGPQVGALIGQIGSTLADLARAAAPVGAAELKIITNTLGLVDAAAKAHPQLVELGIALFTVTKAAKALNVVATIGTLDKIAGVAATGAGGLLKYAGGLRTLGRAEKDLAGASALSGIAGGFAKTGATARTAETGVGKVATKLPGLTRLAKGAGGVIAGLGGALGATGLGAAAMGTGVIAAAAGIGYLGYKLATAKSAGDKYYDSLVSQYHATGNNVAGYRNLATAVDKQKTLSGAAAKAIKNNSYALREQGAAGRDVTGTTQELQDALNRAQVQYKNATEAAQKNSTKLRTLRNSADQVASQFGITRNQALKLADRLNIDLSKGLTGTSKATQQAKQRLAQYSAEVRLSHNPQQQIALDLKTMGDNSYKASDQIAALQDALDILSGKNINASQASDDFQRSLRNINTTAKNGKPILNGYSDEALANRDAIRQAGQAADQHALALKNQGASEKRVRQAMIDDRTALLRQATATFGSRDAARAFLRQLGLLPSQAKNAQDAVGRMTDDINSRISKLKSKDILIQARGNWTDSPSASRQALRGNPQMTFAEGGLARGPGGPTGDKIPAMLSDKEYVNTAATVGREGVPAFDALNSGRATIVPKFAAGGQVNIKARTSLGNMDTAPQAWYDKHLTAFAKAIAAAHAKQAAGGGKGDMSAHSATAAAAQAYARSILSQFGWAASQMSSLISLWNGESGWNNLAQNPSSTAFGIAQFLNSTWAGKKFPKTTNFMQQVYDGLQYIAGSYGTPAAAYSAWLSRSPHWYAKGTQGAAPGPAVVGEDGPEIVWFRGGEHVMNNRDARATGMLRGYASGTLDLDGLAKRLITTALGSLGGNVSTSRNADVGGNMLAWVKDRLGGILDAANSTIADDTKKLAALRKSYASELDKLAAQRTKAYQKIARANAALRDPNATDTQKRNARSTLAEQNTTLANNVKDRDKLVAATRKQTDDLLDAINGAKRTVSTASGTQSALVREITATNKALAAAGRERDRIGQQIQTANQFFNTQQSGARDFASLGSLEDTTSARKILSGLRSKVKDIGNFSTNLRILARRHLSETLLEQLFQMGPDQGGPVAAALVKASGSTLGAINRTQKQIGQYTGSLALRETNQQFGGTMARNFVDGLRGQKASLEKLMDSLGKRLAKSLGHTFGIKGYAKGGTIPAGQIGIVGEEGIEIARGPMSITPNRKTMSLLSGGYQGPSAADIAAAFTAYSAAPTVHVYIGDEEITDRIDVRVNDALGGHAQLLRAGRKRP